MPAYRVIIVQVHIIVFLLAQKGTEKRETNLLLIKFMYFLFGVVYTSKLCL